MFISVFGKKFIMKCMGLNTAILYFIFMEDQEQAALIL